MQLPGAENRSVNVASSTREGWFTLGSKNLNSCTASIFNGGNTGILFTQCKPALNASRYVCTYVYTYIANVHN